MESNHLLISVLCSLFLAPLAQMYIDRFSRMALLENQLEVFLNDQRISLAYCYRIVDRFRSYIGSPCSACGKSHSIFHYSSIYAFFNSCQRRPKANLFIVEVLFAAILYLFLQRYDFSFIFCIYTFLILFFLIITIVDFRYYIIPDELNYLGVFLGLVMQSLFQLEVFPVSTGSFYAGTESFGLLFSIQGILFSSGILLCIAYLTSLYLDRDSMGLGDIKLIAFIGAFLGYKATLMALALSSILGSFFGLFVLIKSKFIERNQGYTLIAYGPYIILATLIIMYFGEDYLFSMYESVTMQYVQEYLTLN